MRITADPAPLLALASTNSAFAIRQATTRSQIDQHDMIEDVLVPWCMSNMFMSFHENIFEFMTAELCQHHLSKKQHQDIESASTMSPRDMDVQYLELMTFTS